MPDDPPRLLGLFFETRRGRATIRSSLYACLSRWK